MIDHASGVSVKKEFPNAVLEINKKYARVFMQVKFSFLFIYLFFFL